MIKNLTNYIDFYVPIIIGTPASLTMKYHTFPFGKVILQNLSIYASSAEYDKNNLKCFITSFDVPVLWEKGTEIGDENSYVGTSNITIGTTNVAATYKYRYLDKTLSIDITVTSSAV